MAFIPLNSLGGESARKWLPIVIPALNKLTCGALISEAFGGQTGTVQSDGVTVRLEYWTSSIADVSKNNQSVNYRFVPDIGDLNPETGQIDKPYGLTLNLFKPLPEGTILNVNGTYGFATMPDSLLAVMSAMISALQNHESGDDRITAKSIEDVSVSYNVDTTTALLVKATQPYASVIDMWALCTKPLGVGGLAMPSSVPSLPYWVGDGDGLGL